ncbi:MAG: hypothetical protein QOF44_3945, partial [Streptomyces sp.]|nr:hypothetical protein [Streptomyces sp.]
RIAASGFGWRQPVAALVALAAVLAPLYAAFGWMVGGADGPVERRDSTQVPAFVAEESATRDQPRTLVLNGTPAQVSYALVRGAGARLGDAELAASAGADTRLSKIVANLVAGSGADQAGQLGGYAVRYVFVRGNATRSMSRTLDSTPGLSRLSQADGSALWRVDNNVSRITIVDKAGVSTGVASGKVEAHTTLPAGTDGRVLRLADTAAPGWTATLDGRTLTATTVDGWAQGFELPTTGGKLDLTYEDPFTHTLWLWIQGFLAIVLVVMALPGRRREIDDDLPEADGVLTADIPEQATGDGRRARRLRAAAEAEGGDPAAEEPEAPPVEPVYEPAADPYAAVPQQQDPYGQQWNEYQDGYQYAAADPTAYQQGDYQQAEYQQDGYVDPYGYGQQGYDPYAQPPQQPQQPHQQQPDQHYQQQPYDPAYDPATYDADGYRRDGSDQQ